MVVGEAGVAEAEPPAHVLEDPDRPVEGRVREVPELQDRVLQDQVHGVLTPQRLGGRGGGGGEEMGRELLKKLMGK